MTYDKISKTDSCVCTEGFSYSEIMYLVKIVFRMGY